MRNKYAYLLLLLASLLMLLPLTSCHRKTIRRQRVLVFQEAKMYRDNFEQKNLRLRLQKAMPEKDGYSFHLSMIKSMVTDALFSDSVMMAAMEDTIRHEIKEGRQPDAIVVVGDDMLRIASLSELPQLKTIPVVFINTIAPEAIPEWQGRGNFTGKKDSLCPRNAMSLAYHLGSPTWFVSEMDSTSVDSVVDHALRTSLADTVRYRYNYDYSKPNRFKSKLNRNKDQWVLVPLSFEHPDWGGRVTPVANGIGLYWFDCIRMNLTYLQLKNDRSANRVMAGAVHKYYTLVPDGFDLEEPGYVNCCMGGFFTPYSEMVRELRGILEQIAAGVRPSDIPVTFHHPDFWVDWRFLRNGKNCASDFRYPNHYVNLPWSERNHFNRWLANEGWKKFSYAALLIILLIFLHQILMRWNTERKLLHEARIADEENQRLNAALAVSNGYTWIIKDEYVEVEKSTAEALGLRNRRFPLLLVLRLIVNDVERYELSRAVRTHDETARKMLDVRISMGRNEEEHWLRITVCHILEEGKDVVMGTMAVIDEEVKQLQEIRESYKAEEQSLLRETFLASMGHEIRTPLNAIVGFARMLISQRDEMTKEEKDECREVITSNNKQLLTLINDVISYSNDSDNLKKAMSPANVAQLMQELYRTHSVIVPKKLNFNLEKGSDDDFIYVSRTSIRQIVSNLLNNACKFTERGDIILGWTSDENFVRIFVKDSGMGIAEEDLASVFKPYFKKQSSSKGAGIGLGLCQQLATAMGGKLELESKLGEGSCFTIVLPRLKEGEEMPGKA